MRHVLKYKYSAADRRAQLPRLILVDLDIIKCDGVRLDNSGRAVGNWLLDVKADQWIKGIET